METPSKNSDVLWYSNGLFFQCNQCGKCCTGFPGYVWVSEKEIAAMASHLGLSIEEFANRFIRLTKGGLSLKERNKTYSCILLKDKLCSVYPVRPKQCEAFPFWPENLSTKESWENLSSYCEGLAEKKKKIAFASIQEKMERIKKN